MLTLDSFFFPWEKGQQQTIQPCSITGSISRYKWYILEEKNAEESKLDESSFPPHVWVTLRSAPNTSHHNPAQAMALMAQKQRDSGNCN